MTVHSLVKEKARRGEQSGGGFFVGNLVDEAEACGSIVGIGDPERVSEAV